MIYSCLAREHREIYAQFAALYRPRTAEIVEIGKKVTNNELGAVRASCSRLWTDLEAG